MDNIKPMSPEEAIKNLIDYCSEDEAVHRSLIKSRSGRDWRDNTQENKYMREILASVLLWARNEFYDYEEEMYQEREATAQDIDAGAFLTRLSEEIIKE